MKPTISYYENGQKQSEHWFVGGVYHRLGGPARECWYENGQKYIEEWLLDGKLYRDGGPVYQSWYENGQKQFDRWSFGGNLYCNIQKYTNALVKRGYMTKSEALMLILKWK